MPDEAGLRAAAEVLNAGKKVAMLVGAGALDAADEVIAVADRLRRGVRQGAARQGRAAGRPALGDRSIGLLGTKPSWDLMKDCDTFFMVGSGFPYTRIPAQADGDARGVQIDLKGEHLSLR